MNPARTYNYAHTPRKYTPGKRRFSVDWSWSYPWESNRDVTELDNRFSTMTEVRRVAWPSYEGIEYSEKMFLQGIAGTLLGIKGQYLILDSGVVNIRKYTGYELELTTSD